jgi:aspartate 1-decarboxylase
LLDASDIRENEQVHIWNIDNGERLVSYAICAARGSGMVPARGPTGGASLILREGQLKVCGRRKSRGNSNV